MIAITEKQQQLLDFLQRYMLERGIAPSYSEMAESLSLKSKSQVFDLLNGLEERGRIRRLRGKRRAIEIIDDDPGAYRKALEVFRGRGCEHTTGGIKALGSCYRDGRRTFAKYGADQACVPCVADRVLQSGRLD